MREHILFPYLQPAGVLLRPVCESFRRVLGYIFINILPTNQRSQLYGYGTRRQHQPAMMATSETNAVVSHPKLLVSYDHLNLKVPLTKSEVRAGARSRAELFQDHHQPDPVEPPSSGILMFEVDHSMPSHTAIAS